MKGMIQHARQSSIKLSAELLIFVISLMQSFGNKALSLLGTDYATISSKTKSLPIMNSDQKRLVDSAGNSIAISTIIAFASACMLIALTLLSKTLNATAVAADATSSLLSMTANGIDSMYVYAMSISGTVFAISIVNVIGSNVHLYLNKELAPMEEPSYLMVENEFKDKLATHEKEAATLSFSQTQAIEISSPQTIEAAPGNTSWWRPSASTFTGWNFPGWAASAPAAQLKSTTLVEDVTETNTQDHDNNQPEEILRPRSKSPNIG